MSTDATAADRQLDDVNPGAIDWDAIFEEYADEDGALGIVDRTRAIKDYVDAVDLDDDAETVLHEAADRGLIELAGDGRVFRAGSDQSGLSAEDIDWESVWETAGVELGEAISGSMLPTHTQLASNRVGDEKTASDLITDAVEQGILVLDNGYRIAGYDVPEETDSSDTETDASTESDDEDDGLRPEVEELRAAADSQDEYVGALEGLVSECIDRLERVENRQNIIYEEHNRQSTGLLEMQLQRLKNGQILSRDGVDEEQLEQMGYDIIVVGEDQDMVRLADRHTADDDGGQNGTHLPDFDTLPELEEYRVKWLLDLEDKESIKNQSVYLWRAMAVWDDAELLSTHETNAKIVLPSWKVREKLWDLVDDDVGEDSMDTIVNRTMKRVQEGTDGVLTVEGEGASKLLGDMEDVVEAKVQQFQKDTASDSVDGEFDNTVVSSVSGGDVSSTGR